MMKVIKKEKISEIILQNDEELNILTPEGKACIVIKCVDGNMLVETKTTNKKKLDKKDND